MCDDQAHPQHLTTNPVFGLKSDAVSIKELSTPERREMLKAVRAGDLIELDVDVVAFRAIYPKSCPKHISEKQPYRNLTGGYTYARIPVQSS